MNILETILFILLIGVTALYVTSKFRKDKDMHKIINDVKDDLKQTASNVADLVLKAKDIIFDENIQKVIKEFIMIVEEKNRIAKSKGEAFLNGDDKKKAVISRLTEWVSNLTGSVEKAVDFVGKNQSKIETIIDDYIAFSNKMEGKATLSIAEKIIHEQLNR